MTVRSKTAHVKVAIMDIYIGQMWHEISVVYFKVQILGEELGKTKTRLL
jgi:hypothetical protein